MMTYYLVGLGNPGSEYEGTRHNLGRMVLETFRVKNNFPAWALNQKINAETSSGALGKHKIILLWPAGFMNKSGASLKTLVTNAKAAGRLVIIHDDLDLPLGGLKIVFNRGAGGHRGVESVAKSIKTKAFIRLRVGISPADTKGRAKKPVGEQKITDFILGKFKPSELEQLKPVTKKSAAALSMIVADGLPATMNVFNQGK